MRQSMTSCPYGKGFTTLVTDPCDDGLISRLSLNHVASVCQVLTRATNPSTLVLSQRAPGIWSLSASSTLTVSQSDTMLHVLNHSALTSLTVTDHACIAGGRALQVVEKTVIQTNHGLNVGDWIILDSATEDWTLAFNPSASIENDAVAQVVNVADANTFTYKPVGPFCEVTGIVPGTTYFVETDGSGALTITEPTDYSVPRIFAISDTEGILLPYRPIERSGAKVQEVFDIAFVLDQPANLSSQLGTVKSTLNKFFLLGVTPSLVIPDTITLSGNPVSNSEDVYLNGLHLIRGTSRDYTISSSVLTWSNNLVLTVGDVITVKYESLTPVTLEEDTVIGEIKAFGGAAAPAGWLLCDGASYATTTYPSLFAVIGYAYGGSGASFNVPDLRGRALLGAGTGPGLTARSRGDSGGQEAITDVPAHTHTYSIECNAVTPDSDTPASSYPAPSDVANEEWATTAGASMAQMSTDSTGDASVNVMPPFTAVQFIIKT